jgi:hypothetical protein
VFTVSAIADTNSLQRAAFFPINAPAHSKEASTAAFYSRAGQNKSVLFYGRQNKLLKYILLRMNRVDVNLDPVCRKS